jgi:putative hydrolase of the HAD superfamily
MAAAAVELVLFDFGGTLFHPAPADRLVRGTAAQLGLDLSPEEIEALGAAYAAAGVPGAEVPPIPAELQAAYDARDLSLEQHRVAWIGLLGRAAIPDTVTVPDPGALAAAVYDQTLLPGQWVPYADAAPTLAALAAREVRVGLISNIGFDLREILHAHGFGSLADTATLSYEVGAMKPDPRIFRAALSIFGVAPEQTVMVGDNPDADGGAAELGITTLIIELTPPGTSHGLDRVLGLLDGLAS